MLLFSVLVISSKSYGQDKFPVLEGPYFGQKPPGLIPELFAPDVIQQPVDLALHASVGRSLRETF